MAKLLGHQPPLEQSCLELMDEIASHCSNHNRRFIGSRLNVVGMDLSTRYEALRFIRDVVLDAYEFGACAPDDSSIE